MSPGCVKTPILSRKLQLSQPWRTATGLGQLQLDTGLAPDASEHLRATMGRFTEGFDTADFRDATATLESLG